MENILNSPMLHYRLKKRASCIFKDVSGSTLPGVLKWAGSLGGEYTKSAKFFSNLGKFFVDLCIAF
jgi:hypothetical protein